VLFRSPVSTGAVSPASPLAKPIAPVAVRLGGAPVEVAFVGLTPGFVGLLQANLLVPDLASGEHTLEVSIGGTEANAATLSVRRP
jgi:uncharacterized protein (TIGR03437 family)